MSDARGAMTPEEEAAAMKAKAEAAEKARLAQEAAEKAALTAEKIRLEKEAEVKRLYEQARSKAVKEAVKAAKFAAIAAKKAMVAVDDELEEMFERIEFKKELAQDETERQRRQFMESEESTAHATDMMTASRLITCMHYIERQLFDRIGIEGLDRRQESPDEYDMELARQMELVIIMNRSEPVWRNVPLVKKILDGIAVIESSVPDFAPHKKGRDNRIKLEQQALAELTAKQILHSYKQVRPPAVVPTDWPPPDYYCPPRPPPLPPPPVPPHPRRSDAASACSAQASSPAAGSATAAPPHGTPWPPTTPAGSSGAHGCGRGPFATRSPRSQAAAPRWRSCGWRGAT
jgi:hypothetical protein